MEYSKNELELLIMAMMYFINTPLGQLYGKKVTDLYHKVDVELKKIENE